MQSEIKKLFAEISSLKDACQIKVCIRTETAPAISIILSLSFPRIRHLGSHVKSLKAFDVYVCGGGWGVVCCVLAE